MGSSCTLGTLGNFQLGLFNTIRDGHVWDGRGSTVLKNLKDFSGKWGTTGPKIGYVMSCHLISCQAIFSFHVISCHFMPNVISCHVMSFHVSSCQFISVHSWCTYFQQSHGARRLRSIIWRSPKSVIERHPLIFRWCPSMEVPKKRCMVYFMEHPTKIRKPSIPLLPKFRKIPLFLVPAFQETPCGVMGVRCRTRLDSHPGVQRSSS